MAIGSAPTRSTSDRPQFPLQPNAQNRSAMRVCDDRRCVHTFVSAPSDVRRLPCLRTDVRNRQKLHARAAHARRPASHPLVPFARGRLRRRLGGRPGRATDADDPSAPGAAARAREALARRRARRPGAAAPAQRSIASRPSSDRPAIADWRRLRWSSDLSVVTLGTGDLRRARAFYEALGWRSRAAPDDDVVFFQTGGSVLSLWDREQLAEDSGVEARQRLGRRDAGAQRRLAARRSTR